MMNWDAIGAVGEIIGAGAVVVSLIYLATQIRTQNKEARLAAMHDISVGFRQVLTAFSDESLCDRFERANEDFDSLKTAEVIRLISAWYPVFRLWEEAYIQWELGRLDERLWTPMNSQFAAYLSMPGAGRIWALRKNHFDKEFQRFVSGLESPKLKFK